MMEPEQQFLVKEKYLKLQEMNHHTMTHVTYALKRAFDWSNLSTDLLAPQQTYQFINNYITCSPVDLSERSIESRTNIEILRFNSDFTEFIKDGDVYVKM